MLFQQSYFPVAQERLMAAKKKKKTLAKIAHYTKTTAEGSVE